MDGSEIGPLVPAAASDDGAARPQPDKLAALRCGDTSAEAFAVTRKLKGHDGDHADHLCSWPTAARPQPAQDQTCPVCSAQIPCPYETMGVDEIRHLQFIAKLKAAALSSQSVADIDHDCERYGCQFHKAQAINIDLIRQLDEARKAPSVADSPTWRTRHEIASLLINEVTVGLVGLAVLLVLLWVTG